MESTRCFAEQFRADGNRKRIFRETMIFAAPIQGFTDRFWRKAHACVIGGISEYVTPFMRLENGCCREKDLADLPTDEPLTVPQLLVKTPEEVRFFADFLAGKGFAKIDLNFGCPYVPLTRRGYGAGILRSPRALEAVLQECARFPEIAFSAKIRLPESPEIPFILNSFQLRHIVLHPRTAEMQYSGTPDREAFLKFASESVNKVIYNGDIVSGEDLPYPDVMIGRGLLRDPLLGRKLQGETPPPALLGAFHECYQQKCMELEQPLLKLKTLWEYFLPGAPKGLRKKILKSKTVAEYSEHVRQLFSGHLYSLPSSAFCDK